MSNPAWRPATEEEIRWFYEKEFASYNDQIPNWIDPPKPINYAVNLSREWPHRGNEDGTGGWQFLNWKTDPKSPKWRSWADLASFFANPAHDDPGGGENSDVRTLADPADVDSPAPTSEAVYYTLENHTRFWVFAFDINAVDFAAARAASSDDTLSQEQKLVKSGVREEEPIQPSPDHSPYDYRFSDLQQAISTAFDLKKFLHQNLQFDNVRVFYSGQGTHVYGLDDDKQHKYTRQPREAIAEYVQNALDIPINDQVTYDPQAKIRIPRSLHAGVSRLVTEIESPEFNPLTDPRAIPAFLEK